MNKRIKMYDSIATYKDESGEWEVSIKDLVSTLISQSSQIKDNSITREELGLLAIHVKDLQEEILTYKKILTLTETIKNLRETWSETDPDYINIKNSIDHIEVKIRELKGKLCLKETEF